MIPHDPAFDIYEDTHIKNLFRTTYPHLLICNAHQTMYRTWQHLHEHYDDKRDYTYIHHSHLTHTLLTNANAAFILGFEVISNYIPYKQCRRIRISADARALYRAAAESDNYLPPAIHRNGLSGKYLEVKTDAQGLRINIEALAKSYPGRQYLNAWTNNGELVDGVYTPKYYKTLENGRMYILKQYSYQTMPNHLKAQAQLPDQQNMDIKSCHRDIAANLHPAIATALERFDATVDSLDKKLIGLGLLNGMSIATAVKTLGEEFRDQATELSRSIREYCKSIGTQTNKLWKQLQETEQEWIKRITDHLDELGVGYVNMHDGLMVDQIVDYGCLELEFEWREKKLE